MKHRLLTSLSPPPRQQLKSASKEDFFSMKHNTKRLKNSIILTPETVISKFSHTENPSLKPEKKELAEDSTKKYADLISTFGSDNFLSFKRRQPKRKRRRQMQHKNGIGQNTGYDSGSDTERSQVQPRSKSVMQKQQVQKFPKIKSKPIQWKATDFIFVSKIGQGTYSEVFKAIQKKSGFVCSLKVLNKEKMRSMKVQQNLMGEIKINMFLQHPNITALYGYFSDQNCVYLIGQLATDHSVHEALCLGRSQGIKGMPLEVVKHYMGQLCDALRYMHQNCIIHRDIKPENMLITFTTTLKLCDFGWSTHNPDKSLRSTLCGTPLYLAPELIQQNTYNESVDIWAAGVVTYEMITSEIPFKIRSIRDLTKVVNEDINYIKIEDPQTVAFIKSALQKRKEERKTIEQICDHPFLKAYQEDKYQ